MRTILPQNTTLSRANTVTVDAERFAQLNTLTDIELRQKLGKAMAMLVKTYLEHVIEENPDFTVGQALEIIELMADDIRKFAGIALESVDEYKPVVFPVNQTQEDLDDQHAQNSDQDNGDDAGDNINNMQGMSADERRNRLFNSFGRNRNRPPHR